MQRLDKVTTTFACKLIDSMNDEPDKRFRLKGFPDLLVELTEKKVETELGNGNLFSFLLLRDELEYITRKNRVVVLVIDDRDTKRTSPKHVYIYPQYFNIVTEGKLLRFYLGAGVPHQPSLEYNLWQVTNEWFKDLKKSGYLKSI